MDEIINKLSEIELIANKIMEDGAFRKKEIANAMEKKTLAFDLETDKKTAKRLEDLKEKLKLEAEQELSLLRKKNQLTLDHLEKDYDENHKTLVKDLFNKVLGV